ncbi:ankyrin, partial [Wilcoxina mikolae CBS 423.85]
GDTPLHFSAKCNNLPLTSYLLSHLYPASTPNNAKWTPLHLAALHDHVELARLLLLHGADVNICFSTFESTPLHRAFSPAMASLLIEFGADVQAKNFLNQTPL